MFSKTDVTAHGITAYCLAVVVCPAIMSEQPVLHIVCRAIEVAHLLLCTGLASALSPSQPCLSCISMATSGLRV